MSDAIKNRYDFVLIFDVKDGNPNGDPDAGNLPRVDPETGEGLVTDVCLKRKVRNYVGLVKEEKPPYEIYVKEKAVLNMQHERAYEALGVDLKKDDKKRKGGDMVDKAREWMCKNFYDVRTFGAVMSTDVNCGQVRGPVQMTFARSIDQAILLEHIITVCAARKGDKPVEEQIGIQGRKFTIPYALYRCHGFISAPLAAQTVFTEEDLELFWEALKNMFEHDRSAARGEMTTRRLVVFKHDSVLGSAPAHKLFERLTITRKDASTPVRAYSDYDVSLKKDGLPKGVTIEDML